MNVIDFLRGNAYFSYEENNEIDKSNLLRNVLKPSRKYYGSSIENIHLNGLYQKDKLVQFHNKLILIIDS